MNVGASIYLDVRRMSKKTGKYPVKLRVYSSDPPDERYYGIVVKNSRLYLSKEEFESSYLKSNPRGPNRDLKDELMAVESRAKEIIKSLDPFTYDEFKQAFLDKPAKGVDFFSVINKVIHGKEKSGAVSTAEKYRTTKSSITDFLKHTNVKTDYLSFRTVNAEFLGDYERYCRNLRKNTVSTIAINMRNIRACYRQALSKDERLRKTYPFGSDEGQYSIQSGGKVNKALNSDQVKILWLCEPQNVDQAIAKDFWFFSYFSYGINLRDICELKHSDFDGESFMYERAKTRTTRKNQRLIEVPVTQNMKSIIAKHQKSGSKYLFGILSEDDTPETARKKISNFNAYINKHFRKFAFYAGIDSSLAKQLGTYHSRHSFATIAYDKTKNIKLISEILHEGNIETTQAYLNSFPKETFVNLSRDMDL